jgi:hypothetical protein
MLGERDAGTRAETGGGRHAPPQALPKKEAEFLREPVGVPAGDPAAQRHTRPNQGVQATANSVRSAPALRRA